MPILTFPSHIPSIWIAKPIPDKTPKNIKPLADLANFASLSSAVYTYTTLKYQLKAKPVKKPIPVARIVFAKINSKNKYMTAKSISVEMPPTSKNLNTSYNRGCF